MSCDWEPFIEKWNSDEAIKMIIEAIIRGDTDYLYSVEEYFRDYGTEEEQELYLETCYREDGTPTKGFKYVWEIWGNNLNKNRNETFYEILRKYEFPSYGSYKFVR